MTDQPTSSPAAARLAWVGTALTALLLFFSFGPVGHPFWAFVALVPATIATTLRPDWRTWRRASFATSWVLWIALLVWLRHVYPPLGWIGLVLVTAYCALYPFVWLLLARWIFPACAGASLPARLLAIGGLAGAWGRSNGHGARFSLASAGYRWRPRRTAIPLCSASARGPARSASPSPSCSSILASHAGSSASSNPIGKKAP